MEEVEGPIDITQWLGKPPEKPKSQSKSKSPSVQSPSDDGQGAESPQHAEGSDDGSDSRDIMHDDGDDDGDDYGDDNFELPHIDQTLEALDSSGSDEDDTARTTVAQRDHQLYIDVPRLSEEEKAQYQYLPGHFAAKRILSVLDDGHYLVEVHSGERLPVSRRELRSLSDGSACLKEFESRRTISTAKRTSRKPIAGGMVDWQTVDISDSEGEVYPSRRRKQANDSDVSEPEAKAASSEDEDEASDRPRAAGRRSARLTRRAPHRYGQILRRSLRGKPGTSGVGPARGPSIRRRTVQLDSSPEANFGTRRSERTRARPLLSMRERHEDEIPSAEEEKTGPKIISTKEVFVRVPDQDVFRKNHRQECDTCYFKGDHTAKGPLVFCQGCTNAYHKTCLSSRGTRDHLVTKIGEKLFVLQCRRCIGLAHDRDPSAPQHGRCAVCNELGELSQPLRNRLTTRQEQLQREENGGTDPITIVNPTRINNPAQLLFRCAQCSRAWHMHHLPPRKTAHDDEEDDDGVLDEAQLAQKRFDYYHRSWNCKDCIENKNQIDALVAWRPIDIDAYVPGTTVDQMPEAEKEYLVKWRAQSYFCTTWMPGPWVWGIVASTMRTSFMRKTEHKLPKMTLADAIPEEVFRVDIVFDVRYSSVVRNSTKEIDLARVKEVDMAFVKYKGLGYEDAIWEKPPSFGDTERWHDFKTAYEDYVAKLHISIPAQSTLKRHLQAVRAADFEQHVVKKTQPTAVVGGELMRYQLEGLNWLLYQWCSNQNAVLADEMGLGKTIQLVSFFATLVQDHKCWPFLVVVPNSTCPNWRREIKKWAPSLHVVTYYGSGVARKVTHDYELFPKAKDDADESTQKKRDDVNDIKAHIVVTSYESVVEEKTRKSLMKVPWQVLVVDEGQRLKSDRTQIYEFLSKFRFPFKVLLTGTPLQNNARELFNLLQFLDRSMNAAEMEAKYANLTQENVPELHETLRKFFLRRTKAQVLTFLPPMAQVIVPVSMSTVQKKVYKSILARNPQLMKSIFSRERALVARDRLNLNNILMQLRKILCHPFVYSREIEERHVESQVAFQNLVEASAKLQLLSLMLPKLQERGHRVLIFSQFLDNLDIIEDFLDGLGLQHRRLDGTISAIEKQKRIDAFNAPDSPYFAFLLSTRAGGVGINLATADTVIILDPDFNPHQDIQALSRAHRIGQSHKVLVFQLMTRNSAEEKIMQIGRRKMALDHVLIERMDKEDDAGEDLESILRHGAQALFEDDSGADDIVYDSASVDRLLDRSQVEDTKTSAEKSAESQFSFARIWANNKASLEDDLPVGETGTNTPNPSIWDKILQERERVFAEEQARKAETFGRGKRRRQNVDYVAGHGDQPEPSSARGKRGKIDHDYEEPKEASASDDEVPEAPEPKPVRTVKVRPFKRVRVPLGVAPHFNGDAAFHWEPGLGMAPPHRCVACDEEHSMGWCRLKVAGVEHCGLCGQAHLGHGRICPHLNDEERITTLIQALKKSTESRDLVETALQFLRPIRAELIQRRRAQERREPRPPPRVPPAPTPQAAPVSVATRPAPPPSAMGPLKFKMFRTPEQPKLTPAPATTTTTSPSKVMGRASFN